MTSDKERWVRTMITEEYGLPQEVRSARVAAASTFSAFLVCGLAPLLPYLVGARNSFALSAVITAAVFFAIGSFKSKWSNGCRGGGRGLRPYWSARRRRLLLTGRSLSRRVGLTRGGTTRIKLLK